MRTLKKSWINFALAFANSNSCLNLHSLNRKKFFNAGVVKLVDILDLGSSAARHGGSSPSARTLLFSAFYSKSRIVLTNTNPK